MELKEFISQTIREIAEGVQAASEQCSDLGVIVNPAVTLGENGDFFVPKEKAKEQMQNAAESGMNLVFNNQVQYTKAADSAEKRAWGE